MSKASLLTNEKAIQNLQDPKYFIETFLWIVNKERERVPFILNLLQNLYLSNRTHFDLILKSRKEGFSSILLGVWLHACVFIDNTRAVVVSHEHAATVRLFERVRYYLENAGTTETQIIVPTEQNSMSQITFPKTNSSFWIGTAGSKTFGRGDDVTHLHLSEPAHYKDQTFLTGVMGACVDKAYRVMETTANGVGESFWRLWEESKDPRNHSPWRRHFFAWHDNPENKVSVDEIRPLNERERTMQKLYKLDVRQVLWYANKEAKAVDKSKMPQEYPSNEREAFISTGAHVINLQKLEVIARRAVEPSWVGEVFDDGKTVSFEPQAEGRLRIWKMPRDRGQYLIAADVAEGVTNGAWSVGVILDRSTWEQVGTFRARLDPGEFGRVLCDIGYFYNNALLAPENNNVGWGTIERIDSEKYPHLLITTSLWPDEVEKKGFPTNEKTKNQIISALRNAVDDFTCYINDPVIINELNTMVRNAQGKVVPQPGCWMDCGMALAIGLYCLKFLTVEESYTNRNRASGRSFVTALSKIPARSTGY